MDYTESSLRMIAAWVAMRVHRFYIEWVRSIQEYDYEAVVAQPWRVRGYTARYCHVEAQSLPSRFADSVADNVELRLISGVAKSKP